MQKRIHAEEIYFRYYYWQKKRKFSNSKIFMFEKMMKATFNLHCFVIQYDFHKINNPHMQM